MHQNVWLFEGWLLSDLPKFLQIILKIMNLNLFTGSISITTREYQHLRNIKHFFRVDIQLYQHEWKLEKREIVWKHDARRAECFHTISSFSNFHEC